MSTFQRYLQGIDAELFVMTVLELLAEQVSGGQIYVRHHAQESFLFSYAGDICLSVPVRSPDLL